MLLDRAIAIFHALLVSRPELVRVRLELARAFFFKGEDALARRHFEHVLAGDLPPAVRENVHVFLAAIRDTRRWHGHFAFSVAPDDNLNSASGVRTVFLDTPFGRLPLQRGGDISRKSGVGVAMHAGGEHRYPLTADLRLRSGAEAAVREHKGRIFDRHVFATHIGPLTPIDGRTEASLLATVSRQWTAGRPHMDRYGLRLEGERRLSRLTLHGSIAAGRRNCRGCDRLDGPVGDIELGAAWTALPTLRLARIAGWSWRRANSEHWRNAGPQLRLGATAALPHGFTVGVGASMEWTEYRGAGPAHNTSDGRPREDLRRTLSLSVRHRAVTVLGFSPQLSLIGESRKTNAQALGYKRRRAELSFVRLF